MTWNALSSCAVCLVACAPLWTTPLALDYEGDPKMFTDRHGRPWTMKQFHNPSQRYQVGAETWEVWLDPDPPRYLRTLNQRSADVFGARLREADGWTWEPSNEELEQHSLVVHWYEAVYEPDCLAFFGFRGAGECVGANFGVRYARTGANDPGQVHWLQFVFSNHPVDGRDHGEAEAVIDGHGIPYYDIVNPANRTYFLDAPRRDDVAMAHHWKAFLFLVEGPPIQADNTVAPGRITIWGGIEWGWQNACVAHCGEVPEPGTAVLFLLALPWILRRCCRPRAAELGRPHESPKHPGPN
ncbi:MAG: PEP-CTERM sorting domain-containing protein [Acidobacteria bacterium]|nr:PEP-CTERM sorting domain-containing protein [Acidobacteriota bacterium]